MEHVNIEIIKKVLETSDIDLHSTHMVLCIPIINRIYKKMIYGIQFDAIKVCDGLIIDGHHRYISALLAKYTLDTNLSHKTSATIKYEWLDVEFAENDWDTPAKIKMLNKKDAKFNNITIDEIISILE